MGGIMAGIYQNNVTRPGLVYRVRSGKDFLVWNYIEVVNLIHYQCVHQGMGKEWEEDFRGWFFLKYAMGVNNYRPCKGGIPEFLYMAIYFAMENYRNQELHYQGYEESLVGVDGIVEGDGGEVEVGMFGRLLERVGLMSGGKKCSGRNVYLEVFRLRCQGYSGQEISKKLGVSGMYISSISDVIKKLYKVVSSGRVIRDPAKFVRFVYAKA